MPGPLAYCQHALAAIQNKIHIDESAVLFGTKLQKVDVISIYGLAESYLNLQVSMTAYDSDRNLKDIYLISYLP